MILSRAQQQFRYGVSGPQGSIMYKYVQIIRLDLLALCVCFLSMCAGADNPLNVSITPNPVNVWEGKTATATATISDASKAGSVTFKITDTAIATVSPTSGSGATTTLTVSGIKSGTTTLKAFYEGKEKTSVAVNVVKLTHTTVAITPTDQNRLKVGIGEQVKLATNPATTVKWSVAGGGTVSKINAKNTAYTAPKAATTSTITVTLAGAGDETINFDVITPTGVIMEAAAPFFHIMGVPSAGFTAKPITIHPTTVSFYRVKIHEGDATGSGSGVFAYLNGKPHGNAGPWIGLNQDNTLKTTDKIYTQGKIQSGVLIGNFTWPIPWQYSLVEGGGTEFITLIHNAISNDAGRATQFKGGASKQFQLNDPTQ